MVGRPFPANCGAASARLATGIMQRKHEWRSDGAEYEAVIPAVPLRCVPTTDVKGKPEKVNTSENAVHPKDVLWKRESEELAALIAEAKDFLNHLDARCPASKDPQPPSFESDAFHPPTSVGEQKLMTKTVRLEKRARDEVLGTSVMLQNSDRSFSGKMLKVNSGISVIVHEEKASVTETMWEDSEDEVYILSPAECIVLQRQSNNKDECAQPPSWKLEKKLERQSSLEPDKECRNVIESQRINIDLISGGTKSDQPIERFPNCELTETKCLDPPEHGSTNLDECSTMCKMEHGSTNLDECSTMSKMEQDDTLKMFSVDDEPEYCENHKELINLEIVQHNHPMRHKVIQSLKLFKEKYELELREGKNSNDSHLEALKHVKMKGMNISTDKPFGHIPGVEIGGDFSFIEELTIVGINCQLTPCVDYVTLGGKQYATSVVNLGHYENEAKEDDIVIFSGQDQMLERGNLALMNSMNMGYPVRVINKRKCKLGKRDHMYVYDGLYKVNRFWQDTENELILKFELHRLPGQPSIHGTNDELGKQIQAMKIGHALQRRENFEVVHGLRAQPKCQGAEACVLDDVSQGRETFEVVHGLRAQPKSHGAEVCVLDDVSQGKEKFKVGVVNGLDEEVPLPFTYITNIVYPPHWYQEHGEPISCSCINGCSDSVQCPCVVKNGGEIPFTEKGLIMRARANNAVHECGASCKCPPCCMNRVSQHGPRLQLEVFKTKSMGWGVRSQNYIMPGSFICEYVGELLGEKEADERIGNDEYLFDICHGKSKEDDLALDAAKCGNIGRFINHSCDPNVFAQKVVYDDSKVPHIMFFAGKRIHPRTELRYDYNYSNIRVRDANGNIKRKDCYCGSRKCTGRLY